MALFPLGSGYSHLRDMLQRPYRLHTQGGRFTFEDADTTAKALLRVDNCLELLRAGHLDHLNGVEHAAVDAFLAAIAEFLVHLGLEAALLPELANVSLVSVYRVPYHTAINAATAKHRLGHAPVVTPLVDEAILLVLVGKFQSLLVGEPATGAPADGALGAPAVSWASGRVPSAAPTRAGFRHEGTLPGAPRPGC